MTMLNLALAFVLELCALAALSLWGAHTGELAAGSLVAVVLAAAAPLLAVAVWGTLVAPKAAIALPAGTKLVLACLIFAAAAAGLAAAGSPDLGIALFAAFALNRAALALFGPKA